MSFAVNQEFLDKYAKVRTVLFDNYTKLAAKLDIRSLDADLSGITFTEYSRHDDEYQESDIGDQSELIKKAQQNDDYKVYEFILLASLSSAAGLSHLGDLKLNTEAQRNFGYTGCFDTIGEFIEMIKQDRHDFVQGALSRLLSSEREISCNEYFKQEMYLKDIDTVSTLLEKHKQVVNISDELKQVIVEYFGEAMTNELNVISSVYKNVLAAAFGLDKYVGVFTFSSTLPLIGLTNNYVYKDNIEPINDLRSHYAKLLKDNMSVHDPYSDGGSYTDRQFEADVIYKNFRKDASKPTYFPHKILEIISLGEWTNTKFYAYKRCNNGESKNLDSYIEYIKKNFASNMLNFLGFCCKKDYQLLSDAAKREVGTPEMAIMNQDFSGNSEFIDGIMQKLKYYTKSVTTMAVMISLDTDKKEVADVKVTNILAFRIKMSSYNDEIMSNSEFCKQLASNKYRDSKVLDEAEECEPEVLTGGVKVVDYSYTFNADKVYARPIFAFKALKALESQGIMLDWNNILLGKYADGSLCRSAGGEKIQLQKTQLHNIYAGSRSGKGVMCFNIFATAIASKLPIFYLDRKPDTAVILKSLGPKMFAVNGGQYDAEIDLEKQFVPSGINYRIPSYMEEKFKDISVRNDYMYFRGMLLLFCLVIFVDKVANKSDPRYMKILQGVQNGAVFVFDEFTNFSKLFLTVCPTAQEWFRNCYSDSYINKWKGIAGAVKKARLELKAKQNSDKVDEAKLAGAEIKLEQQIDSALEFSLSELYFAELAEEYRDVIKAIPELFRAGGNFVKQVQIFIIGQDLPSEYYESGSDFLTSSNGESKKRFNSSTHACGSKKGIADVPMIKMLNEMSGDYILGYQPPTIGKPKYLAQNDKRFLSASMLTASRRCFAYYKPGAPLTYADTCKITDTKDAFRDNEASIKGYLNHYTFFKPFLILNNGIQPPDELLEADLKNNGVSPELETKRKGKGYPQYANSQYVGQCLTSCNRAGLAWSDLLNDNKSESDPTKINDAVGFEGYIRELSRVSGNGGAIPVDELNASGDIMTVFVNEVFGYKDGTWLDFLADFRPEAMFRPSNFIDAIDNPEAAELKARLSRTFFASALTEVYGEDSFASIFADELGTLLQYYPVGGSGSPSTEELDEIPDDFYSDDWEDEDEAEEITDGTEETSDETEEDIDTTKESDDEILEESSDAGESEEDILDDLGESDENEDNQEEESASDTEENEENVPDREVPEENESEEQNSDTEEDDDDDDDLFEELENEEDASLLETLNNMLNDDSDASSTYVTQYNRAVNRYLKQLQDRGLNGKYSAYVQVLTAQQIEDAASILEDGTIKADDIAYKSYKLFDEVFSKITDKKEKNKFMHGEFKKDVRVRAKQLIKMIVVQQLNTQEKLRDRIVKRFKADGVEDAAEKFTDAFVTDYFK